MNDIIQKWGLPRDHVSCPDCGNLYGRYKRKVCRECGDCSKCCTCEIPDLVSAEQFILETDYLEIKNLHEWDLFLWNDRVYVFLENANCRARCVAFFENDKWHLYEDRQFRNFSPHCSVKKVTLQFI